MPTESLGPILEQTIRYTVQGVLLLIIIRAILSFFPNISPGHPAVKFLDAVTEPILSPFRRLVPAMAGMDFSPILAILTLQMIEYILVGMVRGVIR